MFFGIRLFIFFLFQGRDLKQQQNNTKEIKYYLFSEQVGGWVCIYLKKKSFVRVFEYLSDVMYGLKSIYLNVFSNKKSVFVVGVWICFVRTYIHTYFV